MSTTAASPKSKPTILLVPGAWHTPPVYDRFVAALRTASFDAVVTPLASTNAPIEDAPNATCQKDTDAVRGELLKLLDEQGRDVIVMAHSYGGVPAGGAAHGLSKLQRAQEGKKGGVVALIWIAAFVVPGGGSVLQAMGGKHAPWVIEGEPTKSTASIADPLNIMFNDIYPSHSPSDPDPTSLLPLLRPQPLRAWDSPAPEPAWSTTTTSTASACPQLVYIKTLHDKALPPHLQDLFVQQSGAEWKVVEVEAGHNAPFLRGDIVGRVVGVLEDIVLAGGEKGD